MCVSFSGMPSRLLHLNSGQITHFSLIYCASYNSLSAFTDVVQLATKHFLMTNLHIIITFTRGDDNWPIKGSLHG